METTWPVLKPRLVAALINAFEEDDFAQMLDFKCERKLDHLAAARLKFPQKVYEVVGDAECNGWLDRLVGSAREANKSHAGLQAVTADALAGIDAQGKAFYQESVIAEEAGISEDAVLKRKLYRTWKQCSGAPTPCR